MTTQKVTERKIQAVIGGLLVLFSQAALSEGIVATRAPEVIWVTAPRIAAQIRESQIRDDMADLIDAINRRVAEDLAKSIDAIGMPRIELVISETPTRG